MHNYKTVYSYARTEQIIEKSKFITSVTPCETREEAEAFFAKIKEEFRDATHNVPAFIIGEKMELKWMSDDGEPSGTAGPPILRFLEANELTNLAVVVTRYFGGTKLGTGGLVRAYTSSVEQGVEAAGIAIAEEYIKSTIETDYNIYNKIIAQITRNPAFEKVKFGTPDYSEKVVFEVSIPVDLEEDILAVIRDVSSGSAEMSGAEKTVQKNLTKKAH